MKKAGLIWAAGLVVATGLASAPARAQEPSEQAVRKFMEYAWAQMPPKFTRRDGEVIEIDKKKKDQVLIPVDAAREVVITAWRSYRAQVCDLKEDQLKNYLSLVAREAKKDWTKQQEQFIIMLHLTVVQLMTGKVKIVEKDGEKIVSQEEVGTKVVQPCTEDDRKKLREIIASYVKSGPPIAEVAAAAPGGAAAASPPPAAPAAKPAAEKKK